jgi:glucosamine 6-phosphate synthetase-like amidotransferase/phosphosugar isomerase protein
MLEYRGYDSAGIVALSDSSDIFLEKAVGRVSALASRVDAAKSDTKQYTT